MVGSGRLQRILLATERSQFDAGAERLAVELACRAKLGLDVVLPLIGNPEYQIVAPKRLAAAEVAARQALEALTEEAAKSGVTVTAHVREGEELWREIVDEARERRADILVLRKVGRRGMLARLLVGEMVSQVAARASLPVLMVPTNATLWSRCVLTVVDSHGDVEETVQLAATLAALVHAPVQAVVLVGSGAAEAAQGAQAKSQVEQSLRARGVAFEVQTVIGALDRDVADRVRTLHADLLVFGLAATQRAHGHLSAVVQAVIGAVQCPTVIVGTNAVRA